MPLRSSASTVALIATPTTLPAQLCSARAKTEPKLGLNTTTTISGTQYERGSATARATASATIRHRPSRTR
ncbi:Uncharacterised protein [Achromobacter sp. 2789STDY5608615]|nr:Uncharacterised protein [Achromobacter sp. 2789STDY5608615]